MNILCFIGSFIIIICTYILFFRGDVHLSTDITTPGAQKEANIKDQEESIKIDHRENLKTNIKMVLSKAFFMQKDRASSREVVTECIRELHGIIAADATLSPDYILAYRSLISFLESLKEEEVYESYIKMIDTNGEIEHISEMFAWLASCMANSRQNGFNKESIMEAAQQKNVFDYIRLIINRNIFPHLYKKQREFLMPIIDLCENTLIISSLNNERGPDDGPDLYTDSMHMNFKDIKIFNKKMDEFREFPEGIADRIERDNDLILASNIEKLNEYMRNIYTMKVVINNTLTINPTQTMVHELTRLASNVINKIQHEQNRRKAQKR